MLNAAGQVIYVGKAKNLKKRVSSYFTGAKDSKTQALVAAIADIQITVTRTETEALLLEYELIREQRPKFNVVFRDDKSYPYVCLTKGTDFPQLRYYRGTATKNYELFGPYPSVKAVKDSLEILYKVFQLRECTDSYFRTRNRPCLQYQIKRCSAPCVAYIDKEMYAQDVESVRSLLNNETHKVIDELITKMEQAANNHEYELAARIRDQVAALRKLQRQQNIIVNDASKNVDAIGLAVIDRQVCIHLLSIRDGRVLGSKQFFPAHEILLAHENEIIVESFLVQHYLSLPKTYKFPEEIIVPCKLANQLEIEKFLVQHAKKIKITTSVRTQKKQWLAMANTSASESLSSRLAVNGEIFAQMSELSKLLGKDIKRIECFDVSHTQGESPTASCVVYDYSGTVKADYRRFNIKGITPGDDYAAMEQALMRHFSKKITNNKPLPDLLLIDGGKGQLKKAETVINELGDLDLIILGIAKGPQRKAGLEKIFLNSDGDELELRSDSRVLHLLQLVRDEAHRFAITGHRSQRDKRQVKSVLEGIPGIGPNKRRDLLRRFGGLNEIMDASIEDLAAVPGISRVLATRIYNGLHGN